MPILVLGAMDIETSELEEALGNAHEQQVGNFRFVKGWLTKDSGVDELQSAEPCSIVLGTTGMGSVNAAAACALAIERFAPRYVISQGTAGAHDPALHTGDIVLGERIVNINFVKTPHADAGSGIHPTRWNHIGPTSIFAKEHPDQSNLLASDSRLIRTAQSIPCESGQLVTGTIGSGDVWNREIDRISFFHERFGTVCEDMESYAIAQVCANMNVPHLALRVISNSEYYAHETFNATVATAAQNFTLDLIQFCQNEGKN